jgi:tetratricopeptide (TPR) repeat protein
MAGDAQIRRLAAAYREGRNHVLKGNYEAGIRRLNEAIEIAPQQERSKQFEGVVYEPYFPYYYLGLAYLRLRDFDKADDAFTKAKVCRCLTDELRDEMARHEEAVRDARVKPKPDPGPVKPTGLDPNFTRQLGEADAAMGNRRFGDALRIFETLRKLDAAEYGRRNLGPRRDEAARGTADELVRQGDQLVQSGQLSEARQKYQEANGLVPGRGQRGLDDILGRQNQYAKYKGGAEADIKANRIGAALEKLKVAEDADPEQYSRDGLAARAQDLSRQLQGQGSASQKVRDLLRQAQERVANRDYPAAIGYYGQVLNVDPNNVEAKSWLDRNAQFQKMRDSGKSFYQGGQLDAAVESLENARLQDPDRFAFEKLDAILDEIHKRLADLPEDQIAPVRSALAAYLRGDPERARNELETIAGREATLDPRVRAHVFAWLSVAYADLAISARAEAERADLRAKAIERFKQLLAAEPNYQLRDRLISPQILQLLNEARGKR